MATYPITKRGAEMLKAELHKLKTVERPAVIQAISEARAQGDLSENADYDAGKERQGFIEGRIQEISISNTQYPMSNVQGKSRPGLHLFGWILIRWILNPLNTGRSSGR